MRRGAACIGVIIAVASALPVGAADNIDHALHDPSVRPGAAIKQELIAGITEADFLRLGEKPRTVKVALIASLTPANLGMNFNGYSHGGATYTIPLGWTVEVTFINPSAVPHSAVVVEREMLRKVQVGPPAFNGASVPNPTTGVSTGKVVFAFTANEAGSYAIACGIPNHAIGGHWIALEVSAKATKPTLQVGAAKPIEAR